MQLGQLTCRAKINWAGRVRCEPGWRLGPDWAPRLTDYDLWFCWAGRGRMMLETGEIPLFPGSCFWMRPGGRYEASQDLSARLGVNFVHFDLLADDGGPLTGFSPPEEILTTREVEFADQLLQRIITLAADAEGAGPAALLLEGLLSVLLREQRKGGALTGTKLHHHEIIHRVAARMRESPAEIPPLSALAREAGYNTDHFSAVFHQVMGVRPQTYLIRARIERAKQLLAETDLAVGQIAEAVGSGSLFFFSRQFRARTGLTPTSYRASLAAHRGSK